MWKSGWRRMYGLNDKKFISPQIKLTIIYILQNIDQLQYSNIRGIFTLTWSNVYCHPTKLNREAILYILKQELLYLMSLEECVIIQSFFESISIIIWMSLCFDIAVYTHRYISKGTIQQERSTIFPKMFLEVL